MKKYRFLEHLEKFGPDGSKQVISVDEALRYCKDLSEQHYENFSVVTLLLKKSLRPHFANIYAYCRWSDDLSDEVASTDESLKLLQWWRSELDRCFDGSASHPVFIALQSTIRIFQLPKEPFSDLIDAFEQDQRVNRYATFDELKEYCARSANPVGRLVLHLGKSATESNIELSDSICTGLQLANFLQDVARDQDIDRIYLPAETLERFGYSESELRSKNFNAAFRDLMTFEVNRAEQFFLDGADLVNRVDSAISKSVELFVRGGLGILSAIRQINHNVLSKRPKLGRLKKMQLIFQTFAPSLFGRKKFVAKLTRLPVPMPTLPTADSKTFSDSAKPESEPLLEQREARIELERNSSEESQSPKRNVG